MSEPVPTSSASGITWGLEDRYAEPVCRPEWLQLCYQAAVVDSHQYALLSRMDLDVSDPDFWDLGLSVLDKMVGEAEALAESVGLA